MKALAGSRIPTLLSHRNTACQAGYTDMADLKTLDNTTRHTEDKDYSSEQSPIPEKGEAESLHDDPLGVLRSVPDPDEGLSAEERLKLVCSTISIATAF